MCFLISDIVDGVLETDLVYGEGTIDFLNIVEDGVDEEAPVTRTSICALLWRSIFSCISFSLFRKTAHIS